LEKKAGGLEGGWFQLNSDGIILHKANCAATILGWKTQGLIRRGKKTADLGEKRGKSNLHTTGGSNKGNG